MQTMKVKDNGFLAELEIGTYMDEDGGIGEEKLGKGMCYLSANRDVGMPRNRAECGDFPPPLKSEMKYVKNPFSKEFK